MSDRSFRHLGAVARKWTRVRDFTVSSLLSGSPRVVSPLTRSFVAHEVSLLLKVVFSLCVPM